MKKELLSELNPWWDDESYRYPVQDRPDYTMEFQTNNPKIGSSIDLLVGARRVGKTSLMRAMINRLLAQGVKGQNILYFTSDNVLASEYGIEAVIRKHLDSIVHKGAMQRYIFLDEVQDLEKWATVIKYFYDNFKIRFVVTGSSSLILNKDTSKITGRFRLHEILSLSFSEFLRFTNQKLTKSTTKNNLILEEYFYTGGYPEYVTTRDSVKLHNTIDATLYRDLLSIYGIRNPRFLGVLLDYLADKVTTPVSPVRISKDLGVTKETARFYLQYLQDVYLVFPVYRYGHSNRITKASVPKYYFSDTGLLNSRSLNKKVGHFAENAVYLSLRRQSRCKEFVNIYYYNEGQEVDFYVSEEEKLVEVKYKDVVTEEELLKYSGDQDLLMYVKDASKVSNRQAYPEIELKNIVSAIV